VNDPVLYSRISSTKEWTQDLMHLLKKIDHKAPIETPHDPKHL